MPQPPHQHPTAAPTPLWGRMALDKGYEIWWPGPQPLPSGVMQQPELLGAGLGGLKIPPSFQHAEALKSCPYVLRKITQMEPL